MDFAKKEGIARGLQFCLIHHYANENKITPGFYDMTSMILCLCSRNNLPGVLVGIEGGSYKDIENSIIPKLNYPWRNLPMSNMI